MSKKKKKNLAFLKYVKIKRRPKENLGLILDEDGHLTRVRKRQRHLMPFCLSLSINDGSWAAQSSELGDHD